MVVNIPETRIHLPFKKRSPFRSRDARLKIQPLWNSKTRPVHMSERTNSLFRLSLESTMETPAKCWKFRVLYFNPDDPALFVTKRYGVGYTLNFGNPWSWAVLVLIVLAVVLPLSVPFVLFSALRHRFRHYGCGSQRPPDFTK